VGIENYEGFGLAHARHFDQKSAKLFTALMQVFGVWRLFYEKE